ncbi:ABC transporter ATP-binding protein [Variovorax defluvii]|uniref:ABC transporter ATP-binding protein n=1 Tax=Variovorax defluvii TaxID=913761 RepID=A0ABP8HF82_9BURK
MTRTTRPFVEIDRVSMRFGGIAALCDVSFAVPERAIVGLIGPNGAGKTTLFNCISRLYQPQSGDIRVQGKSILHAPVHEMPAFGIGRTFQNLALYPALSVEANVMVGAHPLVNCSALAEALGMPWARRAEASARARVREVLEALGLERQASRLVAQLTYADRKRVEIARALVCRPRLLLLDEPAGGLHHEEVAVLAALIRSLRDAHGLSVLLVEHHLNLVMTVSDHVVALDFGHKIADGPPAQVRNEPAVQKAYLGEMDDAALA